MRPISSVDCLRLWERGLQMHRLDQGLLALSAALPETAHGELPDWPLGRSNRALAELHCASFGPDLNGRISCPECAENLEFQMDARSLLETQADLDARVHLGQHSFRLPTTRDLARLAGNLDPSGAVKKLVELCRTDAGGDPDCRADQVSEEELEEIGERMSAADSLAEIRLSFACARCGHQWRENLDLAAFLWIEIEARAKRLLREVHTLAAAYGWAEGEILSLSDPRRARYLEMVRE